ncbi:MAG: alpha/beta family hydrolase [Cyclobacteriaceae bacterium]
MFAIQSTTILLPGGETLSAEITSSENQKAIFVFAHGAGAGMNHPFMKELSTELANYGIATLRYNFLYMEQKKKRPDFPAVAHQAVAAAIGKAHELFPTAPIFAGGKSFGGRMTSQYLSAHPVSSVKGIAFVGFPLHPAGKPSIERAAHLEKIKLPMLFLQGTRDALAEWALIEPLCQKLSTATLVKIEGADHSFKAAKQNLLPVLAAEINLWINRLIK